MGRVLALVTFRIFPPEMGGQKGVALFYEYLAKHHEVFLAVSSSNEAATNVFPVLFGNRKLLNNFSRLEELKKIIKEKKIEVIISEHSYPGWIALKLARKFNIPFIIHSHNIEALRFQKMNRWWWKLYWQYEKWIHRKADHNFFISKESQDAAIRDFALNAAKCSVITYGTEYNDQPLLPVRPDNVRFLFSGSLDYSPNEEAVKLLIDKINPLLKQQLSSYLIIITGKGASPELVKRIENADNMEFHGFVNDLSLYFSETTAFLNPVMNDTGIKTKVVEAIAAHSTVISTESGATGVAAAFCGNKLRVAPDGDWQAFADLAAETVSEVPTFTPQIFYDQYSWTKISKKAAVIINDLIQTGK